MKNVPMRHSLDAPTCKYTTNAEIYISLRDITLNSQTKVEEYKKQCM